MPLYYAVTQQTTSVEYVIFSETEINAAEIDALLEGEGINPLKEFNIESSKEKLSTFVPITKQKYLDHFDRTYPQFKTVDTEQKLMQITSLPNQQHYIETIEYNEKDQL